LRRRPATGGTTSTTVPSGRARRSGRRHSFPLHGDRMSPAPSPSRRQGPDRPRSGEGRSGPSHFRRMERRSPRGALTGASGSGTPRPCGRGCAWASMPTSSSRWRSHPTGKRWRPGAATERRSSGTSRPGASGRRPGDTKTGCMPWRAGQHDPGDGKPRRDSQALGPPDRPDSRDARRAHRPGLRRGVLPRRGPARLGRARWRRDPVGLGWRPEAAEAGGPAGPDLPGGRWRLHAPGDRLRARWPDAGHEGHGRDRQALGRAHRP